MVFIISVVRFIKQVLKKKMSLVQIGLLPALYTKREFWQESNSLFSD
jgi:hypothetical protein